MGKGVRWFTIHARTMLPRGTQELLTLLGDTEGKR